MPCRRGLNTSGAVPCNVRSSSKAKKRSVRRPWGLLETHLDELRADVLVLADAGNWKVGVPGLTYSLRGLARPTSNCARWTGRSIRDGRRCRTRPGRRVGAGVGVTRRRQRRRPRSTACGTTCGRRPRPNVLRSRPRRRPRRIRAGDGAPARRSPGRRSRRDLARTVVVPAVTHGHRIDAHPIKGSSESSDRPRRGAGEPAAGVGQAPDRVVEQLRAHVERHTPWGLELHVRALEGAPAWQTDPTGPAFDAARRALRAGFGTDPVLMGVGGSIPFVGPFADAFGGIPRCCSDLRIRTAAFTARTRACTSATGTSSSSAKCTSSTHWPRRLADRRRRHPAHRMTELCDSRGVVGGTNENGATALAPGRGRRPETGHRRGSR